MVKRFFMIDTFTGRNRTYRPHLYSADNYFEKYLNFRYVKKIELQFQLNENSYYYGNKISVPLLIVEYGYVDMNDFRWANNLDVDFEFRITFTKSFNSGIFIHVSKLGKLPLNSFFFKFCLFVWILDFIHDSRCGRIWNGPFSNNVLQATHTTERFRFISFS